MKIEIDTTKPLTTLDQDILALVLDQVEPAAEPEPEPETAPEPEPETAPEPEPEPAAAEPAPRRRGRPALKAVEQSPDELQAETRDLVTSMLRNGGAETVRAALAATGFTKFSDVPVEAMAALRAALTA